MDLSDKPIKLYDFNGTLVSVDAFRVWIKDAHPAVHHQFYVVGESDVSARKKILPELTRIYEHATNEGLYPLTLMPHAKARLETDRHKNFQTGIFSTVSQKVLESLLTNLGIGNDIDFVVSVDKIVEHAGVALSKEDPATYVHLAQYIGRNVFSYADDTLGRVKAAAQANSILRAESGPQYEHIFHFNPKLSPSESVRFTDGGIITVNSLLDVTVVQM